jgi:bacteriorhodopsin
VPIVRTELGPGSVQTCWLITEGGDRFVDVKNLATIHMALQFLQFTVFVFIAGVNVAVLQPHFARQFCNLAVVMDLRATE